MSIDVPRSMCDAVSEALAPFLSWEPESGVEMAEMLKCWGPVLEDVASALRAVAVQLEEGPFDKGVAASQGDLAGQQMGLAPWAEDNWQTFEQVHEEQLERQREPPPGAEKWDLSRNQ